MPKEFYFNPPEGIALDLGDASPLAPAEEDDTYLISNVPMERVEIYAPEINFYLRNSKAPDDKKIKGVQLLYEMRAAVFDLAQQTEMTAQIGKRVLVVSGLDQSALCAQLGGLGFDVLAMDSSQVQSVQRTESGLKAKVLEGDTQLILEADQIIWGNCPIEYKKWLGIYDHEFLGHEKTVEALQSGSGTVSYKNYAKNDSSLCLYHGKRQQICGQCAELCPTGAIKKQTSPNTLHIAHIVCIGCGACVAGCPTGAMDSARMPRRAFSLIRNLLAGYSALILPSKVDLESLSVDLDEKILPLVIEDESVLDEWHLISLLQTTGMPVIYYSTDLSPVTGNVIRVINDIFNKKYEHRTIITCRSENELLAAGKKIIPFDDLQYDLDERSLSKREAMVKRLAHLVKGNDFGSVLTGPHLHYGMLRLNQANCTLCLSCAAGCTSQALTVHPENNSLQFTPSLCTCCDNCVQTCPEENCLEIYKDQLVLHPEFFRRRIIARDVLFECVECGKGFAPAKSIQRIAEVMKPKFEGDSARTKSLYCCQDCKAKVMLESLATNFS